MSFMRSHMRGNMLLPPAPSTKEYSHLSNTCGEPFAKESAPGAAVSGSAPNTFTSGFNAFIELASAVTNPPPPMPPITVFTSGASSRISSPSVALPAMKL